MTIQNDTEYRIQGTDAQDTTPRVHNLGKIIQHQATVAKRPIPSFLKTTTSATDAIEGKN